MAEWPVKDLLRDLPTVLGVAFVMIAVHPDSCGLPHELSAPD
jgi:hypothetical protein